MCYKGPYTQIFLRKLFRWESGSKISKFNVASFSFIKSFFRQHPLVRHGGYFWTSSSSPAKGPKVTPVADAWVLPKKNFLKENETTLNLEIFDPLSHRKSFLRKIWVYGPLRKNQGNL